MARNLKDTDADAIQKVKGGVCPVCDARLLPKFDEDGATVRAKWCPQHGEFTTPEGRRSVRAIRERRAREGGA